MDRLRYRIWYYDCYVYNVNIHLGDYLGIGFTEDDQGHPEWLDMNQCAVEQCTGLKDKNGKLIFEGDIVEWNPNPIGSMRLYNRAVGIVKNDGLGVYIETANHTKHGVGSALSEKLAWGDIIGNIHENPELMEAK